MARDEEDVEEEAHPIDFRVERGGRLQIHGELPVPVKETEAAYLSWLGINPENWREGIDLGLHFRS